MTIIAAEPKVNKTRKLIFQIVSGGLFGGLAAYLDLGVLRAETMAADALIVSGVGLIHLLMGVIVGFGLIAPKLGSSIMNVERAATHVDRLHNLHGGTGCCADCSAFGRIEWRDFAADRFRRIGCFAFDPNRNFDPRLEAL